MRQLDFDFLDGCKQELDFVLILLKFSSLFSWNQSDGDQLRVRRFMHSGGEQQSVIWLGKTTNKKYRANIIHFRHFHIKSTSQWLELLSPTMNFFPWKVHESKKKSIKLDFNYTTSDRLLFPFVSFHSLSLLLCPIYAVCTAATHSPYFVVSRPINLPMRSSISTSTSNNIIPTQDIRKKIGHQLPKSIWLCPTKAVCFSWMIVSCTLDFFT